MPELEQTSDAVLTASRALLGVVARSVAPVLDRITVPQFRVLVILSSAPQGARNSDLAGALGVHPSTFTRTADRLVAGGWVSRSENPDNRRETLVVLTPEGRSLVDQVTRRRRTEIATILGRLDADQRDLVLRAMTVFAQASGEPAAEDLQALGL